MDWRRNYSYSRINLSIQKQQKIIQREGDPFARIRYFRYRILPTFCSRWDFMCSRHNYIC